MLRKYNVSNHNSVRSDRFRKGSIKILRYMIMRVRLIFSVLHALQKEDLYKSKIMIAYII